MTKEALDELAAPPRDEARTKFIEKWEVEPRMANLLRGFNDLDAEEPMLPDRRELLRTAIVPKAHGEVTGRSDEYKERSPR